MRLIYLTNRCCHQAVNRANRIVLQFRICKKFGCDATAIGKVHQQAGVSLGLYQCAYRLLQKSIYEQLLREDRSPGTGDARQLKEWVN